MTLGASESLLESILLVLDGGLQRGNSLLPFLLLVIDHLHQVVKLVLALAFILSCHHLHVRLSIVDVGLGAERLLKSINLQGQGDQVLLLAVEHVISDALRQGLENVGLLEHFQVRLGLLLINFATTRVLRHSVELLLGFMYVFLIDRGRKSDRLQMNRLVEKLTFSSSRSFSLSLTSLLMRSYL